MTTALEPPLLTGQPAYSYQITLEDAVVTLRYRFNGRLGAWFVELYTDTGEALAAPRRVIADDPLWAQFLYNPNVPQGMLTVLDTTQRQVDPTFNDLGVRVILQYFTLAEMAAL